MSIDLDTDGNVFGILQISVSAFDHKTKKTLGYVNECIGPGDELLPYWDESAMDVHGIQQSDLRTQTAIVIL